MITLHVFVQIALKTFHDIENTGVSGKGQGFGSTGLNLRGGFKKTIMDYIAEKYPDLVPLYDEIYNKHNRSYFETLEVKAEEMAKKYDCAFVDNEMPYGRVPQGHPVIVDYFYHEEIRGTENTGKRNR